MRALSAEPVLSDYRARRGVVRAARSMSALRFVTGTTGNVSIRVSDGILITPTRTPYETLRPRSLVHLTLAGERTGRGEPSIEWPIHAAIYRVRPDAVAIVHTHSPWATARGFQPDSLEVRTEERSYYGLESVPVVPAHASGSAELAEAVAQAAGSSELLLLAHHGVIAAGSSPQEALERCALAEHLCQVDLLLREAAVGHC